ncbi:hypothetical protein [Chitinophaga deserti]|uniref:hypothetical protein n=1 Tax=Chitinophaga deserti TaxID=2164099 RepID=UPI000D6C6F99|nr:hypothetical protein [Chitinophaga deserti]
MLKFVLGFLLLSSIGNIFVWCIFFLGVHEAQDVLLIALFIVMVSIAAVSCYTCFMLLFKKDTNRTRQFLKFNYWNCVMQIPGFSLFGLTYIYSAGTEFILYMQNEGSITFGARIELLKANTTLVYNPEEPVYFLGINLVPLFIAMYLNKVLDKTDLMTKEEEWQIDAGSVSNTMSHD